MTEYSGLGSAFVPDPYGDEIVARASGTKVLINISYASGAPYQWAYELYRNFCQVCSRTPKLRGNERMEFDFVQFPWFKAGTDEEVSPIKMRVWNTAVPMDPHTELVPYFTSLGEGGGDTRFSVDLVSGSYGKGSRASVLPQSDLMVITTQPGGLSHAITILDTPEAYRRGKFYTYNDDETVREVVQLAELDAGVHFEAEGWSLEMTTEALVHPDVIKHGGVTFILMGHKFREHYTNGDVRKGESDRGLVDALTRRINTKHPVAASYLIKSDASARVDKRVRGREIGAYRIDRRTINTYADWTKRAVSKGRVDLDDHGTYVEWYLLPDGFNIKGSFDTAAEARDSKPGTFSAVRQRENGKWGVMTAVDYWLPYDGKGFLIAQYEHEMVPLYPGKDRLAAHKQWGINNVSVSDRVGLIIHAPVQTKIDEWGVTQNESRSTLTGPNGSPLPLSEWSDAFEAEFPEEIAEALRKMMPTGKDDITPEDVERLRAIIGERDLDRKNDRKRGRRKDHFDPSDPIEHTDVDAGADPNGDAESTGETVKTRPEHESDIPIDDPTVVNRETVKTGKGRKRKVAPVPPSEDNLPNVLLLTAAEWEAVPYKPEHLCEVERNGAGVTTIFLNEGHSIYANQLAYYGAGGQYFKEHPTLRKKVHLNVAANAVKVAYQIEAVVKVLWIAEDIVPFDKDKFAERTDAQAMTDALSGYQNVDHAIKTRIGGSAR